MIEEEMRNHILDQAEANRSQGMGEKEALEEAVRDMGDPGPWIIPLTGR